MKMTIDKIAEIAGCSRGAVDKVLHGRPGVREEVRERVLLVIGQTGYVPLHAKAALEPAAQKTVAVVFPRLNNPFFQVMKNSIDWANEMRREGRVHLEYYFYNEADTAEVLTILEFLEEHTVDALIIRGLRSHLLSEHLNRLSANNTAVVFVDADVPEAKRLCFVSEDCYRSGRIAASLLAKSIGFRGEVALIGGAPAATTQRLRAEGYEDAIRERWPKMRLLSRVYTQDQSVIAYERTCALLGQHPDLRGIFSMADCSGEIGQAVMDCKRAGQVKIICYNLTPSVVALVKKGIVEYAISISPHQQGERVLQIICDYLENGQKPEAEFIKIPIKIALDENIDVITEEYL